MRVWFGLTALAVLFVAIDIRHTPAHPVLKWAFVILTLFTGPFGALAYVLGCREPLAGTHEAYVAARWRQALGSTMHCAAGDGLGIIAGAALAARLALPRWGDLSLEYALGFGFGWAFFQAFAMRSMAGSYRRSLKMTFLPEFLSMNLLMAGMIAIMSLLRPGLPGAEDPLASTFWFVMSMALLAGFLVAYPMNWWLVAHGLKHGMITVREGGPSGEGSGRKTRAPGSAAFGHGEVGQRPEQARPGRGQVLLMAGLSASILALSIALSG